MAINDFYDEHEQGERVRQWFRRNAMTLLIGVLAGIAVILGWNGWKARQQNQLFGAATQFQSVIDSIAGGDLDQAQSELPNLSGNYRVLAALDLAKAQLGEGRLDAAIATLESVDGDPVLEQVRRQRLAQLLIAADRAGDAVDLLAGASDAVALETLGDAHHALGQRDQARDAYRAALGVLDSAAPQRDLVEFKYVDAGGVPASVEPI